MRYFQPKSLTWWSGVAAVLVGVASIALPASGQLADVSRVVSMLAGSSDASPVGLISLGLGLIGIRDRLERAMRGGV